MKLETSRGVREACSPEKFFENLDYLCGLYFARFNGGEREKKSS